MKTRSPKTLLVEFTPRGEKSRTRALRTYLTDLVKDQTTLTHVDLCANTPSIMGYKEIQAYYKRNYQGKKLNKDETALLKGFDEYRNQLMDHDILILSTPVYNFGMPAAVKAWLDAVMQREFVYTSDESGHIPLLQHLKVCLVYTAGMLYDQINENEKWNGLLAEGAELFEYMGARSVRRIGIEGYDTLPEKNLEHRLNNYAKRRLNKVAVDWYGVNDTNLETELL